MIILQETVNIEIASGQSTNFENFTPPAGLIVGCCIYTNKEDLSTINPGFITAKITTDSGYEITSDTDIRDYKRREGGSYRDSLKPLMLETKGKTYKLTVTATENFTGDFKAQLVLSYEPDFTDKNCQ